MTGNYFAAELKKRVEILKEVRLMLAQIKLMVEYNSATVYEIAETLCKDSRLSSLKFLQTLSVSIEKVEEVFSEQWENAVNSFRCASLKKEDVRLIASIGCQLGKSGVEGQMSSIKMKEKELEALISDAEGELVRKGKLYRSLGVLSGAFAAVILV